MSSPVSHGALRPAARTRPFGLDLLRLPADGCPVCVLGHSAPGFRLEQRGARGCPTGACAPLSPGQFRQTFVSAESVTRRKSHERLVPASSPIVTGSRTTCAAAHKPLSSGLRRRLSLGMGAVLPVGTCQVSWDTSSRGDLPPGGSEGRSLRLAAHGARVHTFGVKTVKLENSSQEQWEDPQTQKWPFRHRGRGRGP